MPGRRWFLNTSVSNDSGVLRFRKFAKFPRGQKRAPGMLRSLLVLGLLSSAASVKLPPRRLRVATLPTLPAALSALPAALTAALVPAAASAAEALPLAFEPRGITPEDTIVFILGTVPFLWATVEFWRRIANGDPFGSGSDQIYLNDTSGNRPKGVRRVLGQDAIIAARILFALAFASVRRERLELPSTEALPWAELCRSNSKSKG